MAVVAQLGSGETFPVPEGAVVVPDQRKPICTDLRHFAETAILVVCPLKSVKNHIVRIMEMKQRAAIFTDTSF